MYPYNFKFGQKIQTDVPGVVADHVFLSGVEWSAAVALAAVTNGIHAAVVDTGVQQIVTTAITSPSVPRNITATAGGTATDIKAIAIIIAGTNFLDEAITETLPVFTVDTAGSVTGSKAFKTITSITIPAHDGVGATTAIGFGVKLGLPYKLARNTVVLAYRNEAREVTLPTVTVSASAIESNTVIFSTALNGTTAGISLAV